MKKDIFKFTAELRFDKPSLLIGWSRDSGQLSRGVVDYLSSKIKNESFCEIDPVDFFAFEGVAVENDVAQFSASKFYYSEQNELVIFKSSEPQFEVYGFLNAVLDVASHYCKVQQLYTVNGVISPVAHTTSRRLLAVYNGAEFKSKLAGYGLEDMTWQGPPAISTYLLWLAGRRGLAGASIWAEVPFYLAPLRDFEAIRTAVLFFNERLRLGVDLKELTEKAERQNDRLSQLRQEDAEVDNAIRSLESGLSLGEDQQVQLVKRMRQLLEQGD